MGGGGVGKQRPARPPAMLIVNTRSRLGAEHFHTVHRQLRECGVNLVRSYPIERRDDLARAVHGAVEDGIPLVIVGGGDGTVSSVADLLAYRSTVLGLVPLGTGNDFTRLLGIPADLQSACETVSWGRIESVNLARIGDRYFLSTALVGFPAHMSHAIPTWLKRFAGKAAYLLAASYSLLASRPFRATLTMDGTVRSLETTLIAVGNGRFHAPSRAEPLSRRVDLVDRLVVQAPRDAGVATMLRLAYDYAIEDRLNPELLLTVPARDVLIEAEPRQEIDVDGEMAGWTPTRATIAPGALRVLVPATAHGGQGGIEPPVAA